MVVEEDKNSLLIQPLIPSSSTIISSYSLHKTNQYYTNDNRIIHRILLLLLVSILSIWANHEASKTFQITLLNDTKDTPAGRHFDLHYVSNDKATRIILNTSSFVEHLLYPPPQNEDKKHYYPKKKHIESVTLRLTRRNPNTTATVYPQARTNPESSDYVIDISPALFEDEKKKDHDEVVVVGAVLRGMARVWMWDGGSRAPIRLLDGMVEYIAELAGFRHEGGGGGLPECGREESLGGWWWEDKEATHVARLLHYCDDYYYYKEKGLFIRRLNEAMRDTWHDRVVDDVLGVPLTSMRPCGLDNVS